MFAAGFLKNIVVRQDLDSEFVTHSLALSYPLCCVARRAATKDRHVCRFRASFWMVLQVCCMVLSSASTVRRQVFLGLPLLRFPSGV